MAGSIAARLATRYARAMRLYTNAVAARILSSRPTTILVFLAAALAGPRAVRPARAGLSVIASTGQAAPGGGTFGKHFGVPVINAQGQVAFSIPVNQTDTDAGVYQGTSSKDLIALLRPGGVTTAVSSVVAQNDFGVVVFSANNGTQIVARDINGLHVVANAGDGVRPVGGGPTYTLSSFSDPTIDQHGDVAYTEGGSGPFSGAVAGGELLAFNDFGVPGVPGGGSITGISGPVSIASFAQTFAAAFYDVFEMNNVATSAFSAGGQQLPSGVVDIAGDSLAIAEPGASIPMVSPTGLVFRTATYNLQTNVSSSGVFLVTENMGELLLTTIVKGGDAAPGGGTFANAVNVLGSDNNYIPFDEPQINDNGSIVFVAWIDGGPGHGVYRFTQAHGLEAMALEGHAPYAAAAGFRNAVINNNDVVAFQAYDGSAPDGRAVFITDGVSTVRAGSDFFFGQEGSSTGAFSQAYFGSEDEGLSPLNDHNEVTFVSINATNTAQSVMKFSVDPKWVQPASGSWDVATNWLFSTKPGPESNVLIPEQASGPLLVTGPAAPTTIDRLQLGPGPNPVELDLQSGGPLTATTDLVVAQNSNLTGAGTVTSGFFDIATGGKMTGAFTVNGTFDNSGLVDGDFIFNGNVTNRSGSVIEGNPTFNGNVTNYGTISPGHSPGTVTVNGDLALLPEISQGALGGSDLEIEIGGTNPSDYDVIDVSGHATLGGKLHVTFINGFSPTAGQRFHVLNAGSVSGAFDEVTGAVVTSLDGGLEIGPPGAVTVTAASKALVGCANATTKAGSSFTAARLKALDTCVGGVFKCLQENEAGAKRDACVTKAGTACGKDLAKATDLGTKLTAAMDKACAPVGAADMLAAPGVGFLNVASECQHDFGTTLDTVASIEQCVLHAHACRDESILNAQAPRAHELMQLAGVAAADLDALACLPDNMGTGGDLGAPKGAGKAVVGCEAALFKADNALAAKMAKSLSACASAVDVCVTEKPNDTTCVPKAQTGCTKDFAAIDAALSKVGDAVAKSCAAPAIDFADVVNAAGADMSALAAECTALGVSDISQPDQYAACLERRTMCDVEDLMRLENPRAGELLALGGRVLEDSFCP